MRGRLKVSFCAVHTVGFWDIGPVGLGCAAGAVWVDGDCPGYAARMMVACGHLMV